MSSRPLIVGYGNVLRRDDGLGRHVAELLADDPRLQDALVRACHQLTPELCLDISSANVVVFVDATHGPNPGDIRVAPVHAEAGDQIRSHLVTPGILAALARELYRSEPPMYVVTCVAESVDVGDTLTTTIAAVLPTIADAVVELARTVSRQESSYA